MPDAMVLWKFITENFTDPVPVLLTAGQGASIAQQKTEWVRRNLGPNVRVILAPAGEKKPEHIIQYPSEGSGKYVTHVLIDDLQKNINAWNNEPLHRIAILHKNAAESIKALQPFISK